MAVATVNEYLSALEKSKLLAPAQLAQAQTLAGDSSDAASLARALARENLVSRWQAGALLSLGQRAQLRLGKYKLIQPLGKGGMGTVFLAEHVTMNRRVALKIVPRSIAEDRASLDRFFAEARAIAALDHPNIVQAYSVDNEMDRYFIVMEFVDGQDLQRMVDVDGPLEFGRAADYIRQAAEGLAHAHARNLVHCDIKPSNLLLNNQGVIKILDLGLARLNRGNDAQSSGGEVFTVDYMAPEQGLGTSDFDHRADIYSLGCTLYFLLTGHPPFPEGSIAQRIVKHQTQEPRDILAERPDTPPRLVEICKRMMAKQPEDRYQTIQEVSAALAPLAADGAGAAGPRAVKALDDSSPNGNGAAGDWLAGLKRPSTASARSGAAMSAATRPSAMTAAGKSNKQAKKGQPARGFAASLAGVVPLVKARCAWFNSSKRIVIGAIGATVALAAITGLAALPFLLSWPKVASGPQASSTEKPKETGDAAPPPQPEPEKRPSIADLIQEAKQSPQAAKPSASAPQAPAASAAPSKPLEKPPVKPPSAPLAKSAPQPDKPKPPSAKPAEIVKTISFKDLLPAVDLPVLNKGAAPAVSLGKLELSPAANLVVELVGGEKVGKGNPKFELQKDEGGSPAWSVQMTENKKDFKIAKVILDTSGECKIEWTDEAKDKATLLRYCGLRFTAGGKPHFTALTAPKFVPPLGIETEASAGRLKRGNATTLSREFSSLPDASVLRLEILELDKKAMPKHEVTVLEKPRGGRSSHGKAQEPVAGRTVPVKGEAFVIIKKERTPPVALQITFETRLKDVTLDVQATCEVEGKTFPFNSDFLQMQADQIGKNLTFNESSKRKLPKEMVQLAKTAEGECKALVALAGELNQAKAAIPFSVYALVGDGDNERVVIFQSGQVEPPKSATPKKNKMPRQKGRISNDADLK